jgi:hypothetical protein
MPDDEWFERHDEDEVEVTDLRPRSHPCPAPMHVYDKNGQRRRTRTRRRRRVVLGASLLVLLAVLLGTVGHFAGVPFLSGAPRGPAAHLSASPTPTSAFVYSPIPSVPLVPPLTLGTATPTALPGSTTPPPLGVAPPSCSAEPPGLTPASPPAEGEAIGFPPVRVGGFTSPYATLRLGSSALSYGWESSHTRYGWPAGILLVVRSDFTEPVTLTGWNPRDGHPLWFGFIEAGVWGAPTRVLPGYTLDPTHPFIPAGGTDGTNNFWYGYVFLPAAGCYAVAATWPGGAGCSWSALGNERPDKPSTAESERQRPQRTLDLSLPTCDSVLTGFLMIASAQGARRRDWVSFDRHP